MGLWTRALLQVLFCRIVQWQDCSSCCSQLYRYKIHPLQYPREKNNGFPILDIFGYLKSTHKNPKIGRVRQIPIWELGWEFPDWDLSHFSTLKYPKLGIRFFFPVYPSWQFDQDPDFKGFIPDSLWWSRMQLLRGHLQHLWSSHSTFVKREGLSNLIFANISLLKISFFAKI